MGNFKKAMVTGAVFLGGYLIGFYEYKYKVMKAILESQVKENDENKEKESQK